jgi:hypothetical protein
VEVFKHDRERYIRKADGETESLLYSQATELVVERRSIGRVFNDRVMVELDSAV